MEVSLAQLVMNNPRTQQPFKCYSQMGSLQAHNENKHNKHVVELTCQYCEKLIKGRSRLNNHMRTHRDQKFKLISKHCVIYVL
ncbi:hypothetical protein K1T71_003026 [Dendrolimus kikuchii]|uniref:Uncharacterized protein n=1 Tax=Dendrolimus kikuchii TaxID=765133 RepID=A0ACC1DAN2_9NEOP|nr:hypothetical protein K1T71_003026 [Dendrolimus kikuchii]